MTNETRNAIEQDLLMNPNLSAAAIADRYDVDETDIISIIHANPSWGKANPHDQIDEFLKISDFTFAGQAATGKWADQFAEKLSRYEADSFFEIRKRDPQRRKYALTDEYIIVRKCIDGDFYDNEYPINSEIADLINSLKK